MGCLLLVVLLLRLLPLVAHGDQLRERGAVACVRRIHRGKSRFLITNRCLCSMDAQVDRLRWILVNSYRKACASPGNASAPSASVIFTAVSA